jgi:glycosyltransferase involved in cell wall biosynthesis
MKDILIDIYKINDLHSGLGQFSLNFAKQLIIQKPHDLKVNFLFPKGKGGDIKECDTSIQFLNTGFQKRYLPFLNKKYSIWHSLYQLPSFFPNRKTTWILTIHDLNFLTEKSESKASRYLKRLQRNIDRANYITTISNFSKEQIEKNLDLKGKSIHVIYNGVAPNVNFKGEKPAFVKKNKFFFSIAIITRKKNFHVLLPIMKHFDEYQLIIAGKKDTSYGKEIQKQIRQLNLEDKIILPGKIDESDKYWLYTNCEAFLFPSLAEGFGMPVIEAMKAGKPVFLSKFASLPEIGGDKAFYFENFEENYMYELIKNKLDTYNENRDIYKNEIVKYAEQFNWNNCISEYLKLYKQIE